MRRFLLLLLMLPATTAAKAQTFQNYPLNPVNGGFNGSPTGLAQPTDQVLINRLEGGVPRTGSLPLADFASAQDIQSLGDRFARWNAFVQRDLSRLSEGVALSNALTIMPPNPGDRYSVTFSGAAFNSNGAGSVSLAYRLTDQSMAFAGYARSRTQNVVKGGVTFSFH